MRSAVENAFEGVLTRLERATPEQRQELFWMFECRWCWDCGREYADCDETQCANREEYEPDLSVCPGCGGEADNGHDRCLPPSPYYCTKCDAEGVE